MTKRSEHTLTEAMELWKRVMDWTDDPFVECNDTDSCCFFCGEYHPDHAPDCVWPKAVELVKADDNWFTGCK